jgi:hypothetical protein
MPPAQLLSVPITRVPGVAGGRPVDGHLGVQRRDPAIVGAVEDDGPFAVGAARDLEHRPAVGGHLDVDQVPRHVGEVLVVLPADAGEHDFLVGVFVVHAKQAARSVVRKRHEPDVVVVVAEALELVVRRLGLRIERGDVGEDRVAPADEDVRVIALGDVMARVVAALQFGEGKGRRGRTGLRRGSEGRGAEERGDGGDAERAAQNIAPAVAPVDDVAEGARGLRAQDGVVGLFEGFRLVSEAIVERVGRHQRKSPSVLPDARCRARHCRRHVPGPERAGQRTNKAHKIRCLCRATRDTCRDRSAAVLRFHDIRGGTVTVWKDSWARIALRACTCHGTVA